MTRDNKSNLWFPFSGTPTEPSQNQGARKLKKGQVDSRVFWPPLVQRLCKVDQFRGETSPFVYPSSWFSFSLTHPAETGLSLSAANPIRVRMGLVDVVVAADEELQEIQHVGSHFVQPRPPGHVCFLKNRDKLLGATEWGGGGYLDPSQKLVASRWGLSTQSFCATEKKQV